MIRRFLTIAIQRKVRSNERLLQQLNTYYAARHQIRLDPEARTPIPHLESIGSI